MPEAVDIDAIQGAYAQFLRVWSAGGFEAPAPGEWDAEHLFAHIVAAHVTIASIALAVAAGQRVAYDNRVSLDKQNLRRIIAAAGDLSGLAEAVRRGGEVYCTIASQLTEFELDVRLPVFIVSNDTVIVDEPWPLRTLVEGIAHVHLPRHTDQLRTLRQD
jgi:hypothetical protein